MTFRKMVMEFKLKFYGCHPREPLLIAWYQHHCRYYSDENNPKPGGLKPDIIFFDEEESFPVEFDIRKELYYAKKAEK